MDPHVCDDFNENDTSDMMDLINDFIDEQKQNENNKTEFETNDMMNLVNDFVNEQKNEEKQNMEQETIDTQHDEVIY